MLLLGDKERELTLARTVLRGLKPEHGINGSFVNTRALRWCFGCISPTSSSCMEVGLHDLVQTVFELFLHFESDGKTVLDGCTVADQDNLRVHLPLLVVANPIGHFLGFASHLGRHTIFDQNRHRSLVYTCVCCCCSDHICLVVSVKFLLYFYQI